MNAAITKTAWHGLSAAVMQNAPAIAAGLAIAAGAVALYKAVKYGSTAKEELETAKQAKKDEEIKKFRELMAKADEALKKSEEEIEA